jgi:hypothetical protein
MPAKRTRVAYMPANNTHQPFGLIAPSTTWQALGA